MGKRKVLTTSMKSTQRIMTMAGKARKRGKLTLMSPDGRGEKRPRKRRKESNGSSLRR